MLSALFIASRSTDGHTINISSTRSAILPPEKIKRLAEQFKAYNVDTNTPECLDIFIRSHLSLLESVLPQLNPFGNTFTETGLIHNYNLPVSQLDFNLLEAIDRLENVFIAKEQPSGLSTNPERKYKYWDTKDRKSILPTSLQGKESNSEIIKREKKTIQEAQERIEMLEFQIKNNQDIIEHSKKIIQECEADIWQVPSGWEEEYEFFGGRPYMEVEAETNMFESEYGALLFESYCSSRALYWNRGK